MQVAILGLGRMGGNMARRLRQAGHEVVGWNRSTDITQQISKEVGLVVAKQVEDVVKLLETPRAVWLMLPAGDVTENILGELIGLLSKGDIVVEGGNSNFRDTMRRAEMLGAKGIHMLDAGVSGGI